MYKTNEERANDREEKRRIRKQNSRNLRRQLVQERLMGDWKSPIKYRHSRLADYLIIIGAISFIGWMILYGELVQTPIPRIQMEFAMAVAGLFIFGSGVVVIWKKELPGRNHFLNLFFGDDEGYIRGPFAIFLGSIVALFALLMIILFVSDILGYNLFGNT